MSSIYRGIQLAHADPPSMVSMHPSAGRARNMLHANLPPDCGAEQRESFHAEEYEPPVHPEFLGKRLQEAAAGAAATSATPPDALTKAWPRGGAPLTAPLLLAAAPVGDATAGDAGTAIDVDLRPRLPPGAAVTLDGLAEALGWNAQVANNAPIRCLLA